MPQLTNLLRSVLPGRSQQFGSLTIVPLKGREGAAAAECITLPRALNADSAWIEAWTDRDSVTHVRIVNHEDVPLLLLAGDDLVFDDKHHVLNRPIVVPPHVSIEIPDACFDGSDQMDRPEDMTRFQSASTRNSAADDRQCADCDLRKASGSGSRDDLVWPQFADLLRFNSSPAGAREKIGDPAPPLEFDALPDAFPCVPGQRGHVAFIHGRMAGLGLFSDEAAYADSHERLIREYALRAAASRRRKRAAGDAAGDAFRLLEQLFYTGGWTVHDGVGAETRYEITMPTATGLALVYRRHVVYLRIRPILGL